MVKEEMDELDWAILTEETLDKLVETNDERYNWEKLAEELFELGEVVMKKINKPTLEGVKEKLIEEMGDVQLRMNILERKLNIYHDIQKRMDDKMFKYASYLQENKYIGRI